MKAMFSLILISFIAVGCSRNQSPVESALDQANELADGSDEEEYHHDEGLYSEAVDGSAQVSSLSTGILGALTEEENEEIAEDSSQQSSEELIGGSWSDAANLRVLAAVKEIGEFTDSRLIPLAHFRREARSVVIVWPALSSSGELNSSTVYGVCVEERGSSFESCGDRWVVNEVTASAAALDRAFGGEAYEVVNTQAASSLDTIGTGLTTLGNTFVDAASEGDQDLLFQTAQEFMELLPTVDVAFDNSVAELLVAAAQNNKEFLHIKTEVGDLFAAIALEVRIERRASNVMSLTAQRIDGATDQWMVVDYW